jgi:hypothetical protein
MGSCKKYALVLIYLFLLPLLACSEDSSQGGSNNSDEFDTSSAGSTDHVSSDLSDTSSSPISTDLATTDTQPPQGCDDSPCDFNATCTEENKNVSCECNVGWQGDGYSCQDIDECELGIDDCDSINGTCTNTQGSYTCGCNIGYHLDSDSKTCLQDTACTNGDTRSGSTTCGLNNRGYFQQECLGGTWQNTSDCIDPDSCEDGDTRTSSTPCGNNGTLEERCLQGQWQNTTNCLNEDTDSTDTSVDSDTGDGGIDTDVYRDFDQSSRTYCENTPVYDASGTYSVILPESFDVTYSTEHFVARWNNSDNVNLTQTQTITRLELLEPSWDFFMNVVGFMPPYYGTNPKYKVNVFLSDQGYATGSGNNQFGPSMWLHFNTAFGNDRVMTHEFAHGLQFASRGNRDSNYVGWFWESHAEWMTHQAFSDNVGCSVDFVNAPHIYYGSTRNRYCNWMFWEYLKDTYCYRVVNEMWTEAPTPEDAGYRQSDPFEVLANNMNWSWERLNDEFGWFALRNATWDYDNGDVFYSRYGSYDDQSGVAWRRITKLESLDASNNRYAVPDLWAPQRWGYNLIRLHPEAGSSEVKVTFRGRVQQQPNSTEFGNYNNQPATVPDPDSQWRYGIVALQSDGTRRYSPLRRGTSGTITFPITSSDEEIWLTVTATPTSNHKIGWDQIYYTIYRYPYMVQIDGAYPEGHQPNSPNPSRNGDIHSNGGGWVSSAASVDASAYVGPYAVVLGGTVSGNARIEDQALIISGTIRDNAVVGGSTIVRNATVRDNAVVKTVLNTLTNTVSGTAQVYGDMELRTNLSSGVFYGYISATEAGSNNDGANRTAPSPEVTAPGPYTWY